ncbi:phosphocholine-specific phospholipase C [Komagataeibacter sp. FNDCF1]|uniref:phosphocholine-specific phospholipase C n=1 Tax=Komagataeibacter sp. FNDCF1 TaxID=2878681 RepID=UPI001E3DFFEE|nr:phospholipase C, phosphocholine-specific [Komagataeibacter sp. FNDCF1]MCE2565142.1 phospholipase C, phosphocholine-specific [Komagataeibacter sp. FNDCF1]
MTRSSVTGRRRFLQYGTAALAAATLPENVRRALAIPARSVSGTITDVKHVVILMQENRSFDHYFGTLRGVRGYSDPRAITLPGGASVFEQPAGPGRTVLPFRFNTHETGAECLPSLNHDWKGSQQAWNRWDCWVPHKTEMTMGYFTREDIPYYHALADAFTIGDSYHASLFGPTNPNRLFLFSGTSGLAVGDNAQQAVANIDDGNWTGEMAHDDPRFRAYRWNTYADRLLRHGISWKLYQEYDNFGDNALAYFARFRNLDRSSTRWARARSIAPGSTARNAAQSEGRFLLAEFERDIAGGRLPQVSWIVAPTALTEHPDAPPGYGEFLISRMMDIFVRHPETWARTVFILNYDENDGFFDHVPAPVPALDPAQGASNVSTRGESYFGVPVGLGPRVPLLAISPWSKGGWVCSEVFDHTSVIRFLEKRFGVHEPNITPWRRSVCGDLTSLFDFSVEPQPLAADLPDTTTYLADTHRACMLAPPRVPERQSMPVQEPGQRPARALPYRMTASAQVVGTDIHLAFSNTGTAGVVLRVDWGEPQGPRHYTIAAASGMTATGSIPAGPVIVQGPNGFLREFRLESAPALQVHEHYHPQSGCIALSFHNRSPTAMTVHVRMDSHDGVAACDIPVPSRSRARGEWNITVSDHWYDLHVTCNTHPRACWRLAGHMETGRPSRSDPSIGRIMS